MPPKRKPKGEPISAEEAAAKKDAQKAKAAEKKMAKLQAAKDRKNFLKMERLRQEIEHGELTTKRFCRTWRESMMTVKIPQIKEDLEVAWHTFDRSLDIKNYSISLLLDEIDSAQEQYQVNERAHLEIISRLINTYKGRLTNEGKMYERKIQDMIAETLAETKAITLKQTDDEVFLRATMFAMEQRLEVLMKTVQGATISKVGEAKDNNLDVRRGAKLLLERKFHDLWDEYVANLTKYDTDTETLRKEYSVLKEKDDRARRIIAKQLARTVNLFDSVRKLKDKIGAYKVTAAKEIAEIMAEWNFFNAAYWTVKTRFVAEQTTDKEQLKIVTGEFNTTMAHLKRILTKGENLLSLVNICRKYETLEEKLLPFKHPVVLEEYSQQLGMNIGCGQSNAVMQEFRNLELFWRRVGSAQLITTQLRSERDRLRSESRCLRQCLQHCLAERSLPPEPTPQEEPLQKRRPVVVDATLCKF